MTIFLLQILSRMNRPLLAREAKCSLEALERGVKCLRSRRHNCQSIDFIA